MPDTFSFAIFNNKTDRTPQQANIPLDVLRSLTNHMVYPQAEVSDTPLLARKAKLPLWGPALFDGMGRTAKNVISVSCFVLDIDDGTPIDITRQAWADVFHLGYTSYSHTTAHPKYRVVIPLDQPVPVSKWAAAWETMAQRSPSLDRRCSNPDRMYFFAAVHMPNGVPRGIYTIASMRNLILPLIPVLVHTLRQGCRWTGATIESS